MCVRVVNVRGLNTPEKRAGIVYVGRRCAGWAGHKLGNPFKGDGALVRYRRWLLARPTITDDLCDLLDATKDGELPLGCWCTSATAGDGSPEVCHGQILAEILADMLVRIAADDSDDDGQDDDQDDDTEGTCP